MHARTILTVTALGLGLTVGTLAAVDITGPATPHPVSHPVTRSATITEDDPRWDCHTMGNRVCGTGARPPLPSDAPTGMATIRSTP